MNWQKHTPGPWKLHAKKGPDYAFEWYIESELVPGVIAEGTNNASDAMLIADAGTAASACEALGYDGAKCIEALPELIACIQNRRGIDSWCDGAQTLLRSLKG